MDYKKEAKKLNDKYAKADCGIRLGWCDTKKCPLWGDRKGRWDGYCVTETYLYADDFIEGLEYDIHNLQTKIDILRYKIRKIKSFKKRFEEYLEERK